MFVFGRCYCQVAVVIAIVVDSSCWQMLLPMWLMECLPWGGLADVIAKGKSGRWNSHWVNVSVLILMSYVGPHPIYEVDGICLCFYLGMHH